MTTALLRLIQLTDSSFPTGGYAFSHGLEGLLALGVVRDVEDVSAFARAHIDETLAQQDLPALFLAHLHASEAALDAIRALDELLTALKPVPAFRSGSTRLGRRMLEAALPLFPSTTGERVLAAVRAGEMPGNHAVAFGVVAQAAGIARMDAVAAFGASSLIGYAAAAVRLGIIGQCAAQRIIAGLETALGDAIAAAPQTGLDDLGGYLPLVDIAGMRQASLPARPFAS